MHIFIVTIIYFVYQEGKIYIFPLLYFALKKRSKDAIYILIAKSSGLNIFQGHT